MIDLEIKKTDSFTENFIKEYCQGGFGRLSKRDVDILVFHLLIQDGCFELPKGIFKVCRILKLTETKVRNLYQEVQLRYTMYAEKEAKERFIALVEKSSFEMKGERVVFIVREPLLRQYFEEWVANNDGFTDSSFNKNIVTLHKKTFIGVLGYLSSQINEKEILGKFSGELTFLNEAENRDSLVRLFVEEFIKSAGNEAGALSVKGITLGLKALVFGIF